MPRTKACINCIFQPGSLVPLGWFFTHAEKADMRIICPSAFATLEQKQNLNF
ncbi:hypothetical protein HMPREF1248_0823 [Coriobacteriaceae bacterium BV3Ac1]|nr:hypothetical protein HMPREF1248_0823 [Coriobacteriaceae bacterium BV3Ac1]